MPLLRLLVQRMLTTKLAELLQLQAIFNILFIFPRMVINILTLRALKFDHAILGHFFT